MSRSSILRSIHVLLVSIACVLTASTVQSQTATYDVLIRNGRIVDGTGSPWFVGDLAIKDGKIVAIGRLNNATRAQRSTPQARSSLPDSST